MSYFFPNPKPKEQDPYKEQSQKKEEKYVITAVQMEEPKKEEGYEFD